MRKYIDSNPDVAVLSILSKKEGLQGLNLNEMTDFVPMLNCTEDRPADNLGGQESRMAELGIRT